MEDYMKRFLVFVMLLFLLGNFIFAQTASAAADFNFEVRDGTITITGLFRRGSAREVVIPARINNVPVTHIGNEAFRGNNLIAITIPNSVTHIGDGAFRGNNLIAVTIPNSVTHIGDFTFMQNQLTSVTIPNSVTHIGNSAFMQNQLTSVTIPNSVTSIGGHAFRNNQLTNVTIPASVTSIGSAPFCFNPRLTAINVSPNNPNFSSVNGVLYDKSITQLLQWPAGVSGTVSIPNSVARIGTQAFMGSQLTSFAIPNSVTQIGRSAFYSSQLSSITIPNSVMLIEEHAFRNNRLTSIIIPNSVTSIGMSAFMDNQLTSVTIGNSVTSIGEDAFRNNQLTSVTIGNSVTQIGDSAFRTNELASVIIPVNVNTIGSYAFFDNPLTTVTFEGSETRFNEWWSFSLAFQRGGNMSLGTCNLARLYAGAGAGVYRRDNPVRSMWTLVSRFLHMHSPFNPAVGNNTISAGIDSVVAIGTDGSLWAWGSNSHGQLGDGTRTGEVRTAHNTPFRIGTDTNWESVSTGSSHTVAIKTDGSLWAWGNNSSGQLGDGTTTTRLSPTRIGMDINWKSVTTGSSHTVAIKTDGSLWAWGDNSRGQLSDGTTTSRLTPTRIGTDNNWTSISTGHGYTAALKTDGSLWLLGAMVRGRPSPILQVGADTNWANASVGALGIMAISTDGSLWLVFGPNPGQIERDTNWAYVSVGSYHNVAIRTDGSLWTWGQNWFGSLGDGSSTTRRTTPARIGTDTNWAYVFAGDRYTIAIKTDGSLWAWGRNENSQLGDGTQTTRYSPIQIAP
jgi:alpha-tubulin suppressor-like RCC1 family protein